MTPTPLTASVAGIPGSQKGRELRSTTLTPPAIFGTQR